MCRIYLELEREMMHTHIFFAMEREEEIVSDCR